MLPSWAASGFCFCSTGVGAADAPGDSAAADGGARRVGLLRAPQVATGHGAADADAAARHRVAAQSGRHVQQRGARPRPRNARRRPRRQYSLSFDFSKPSADWRNGLSKSESFFKNRIARGRQVDKDFTASCEPKVTPLTIALFLKHNSGERFFLTELPSFVSPTF